jgi:hypothetical protein
MARISEKDRCHADQQKIVRSTRNSYQPWEDEYCCDMLEQYYYGQQYQNDESEFGRRKYVINLFYSSINISRPSLLFQLPTYRVTPKLTRMDDQYSDVEARAKLQEQVLNTFVQDPDLGFTMEVGLSLLDAQFRFGLVEVGYTADYSDNPNADKPIMVKGEPMTDADGAPVMDAKFNINSEALYLKWIAAKQVRISERSTNRLANCDWYAYYEWQHIDDIKKHPLYKNTDKLNATGRMKGHKEETGNEEDRHPGMLKVWKMWDLRSKTRKVFGEGCEKYFLEEPFKFVPHAVLKFDDILGQFLPLPPSFNWAHPQNQLNDIRDKRKTHRDRATRRYLRDPRFLMEEFAKLRDSDDMEAVECSNPVDALIPVPDAPLDPAVFRDEATVLEDFTRVSGISGEAQQVAQSETATQANLIALMSQTRENQKRMQVGAFLGDLGRIILMTIKDKMALPMWIKKTVDPYSPMAPMEAQQVALLWEQIAASDLGDIDNDIRVDLASMSPVQQAQERQDFLAFLATLNTPGIGTMLLASPWLMRKTAGLFNIHSERDLAEVGSAVQMMALMQASQGASAGAAPGGAQGAPQPGPTPTNSETMGQLENQMPMEGAQ